MSEDESVEDVTDSRQGIQSVEIGSKVLFALARAGGPLSLNELGRLAGEAPNKVHRYLVSLGRVGLTSQSVTTGRYDLGPALRRLGAEALRRTNEIAVATEYAGQLRDQTGYAVNVAVWTDSGPVIVRWEYGLHALSLTTRIGASLPIVDSAAGQVFLALLPTMMTRTALETQYGPLTDELQQKITKIVKRIGSVGHGRTDGGLITSHLSLSAPILAASDPMPVILTIVMPRDGVTAAQEASALTALKESASAAVMELGGPPPGASKVSRPNS